MSDLVERLREQLVMSKFARSEHLYAEMNKQREEAAAQIEQLTRERNEAREQRDNLLARIFRDGGQTQAMYESPAAACEEADVLCANYIADASLVATLRERLERLEQRQKWLDEVGPAQHPDDERHWVMAYVRAKKRLEAAEKVVGELVRVMEIDEPRFNEWHDAIDDGRAFLKEQGNG